MATQTTNLIPDASLARAIGGLEERAEARRLAADDLQRMADRKGLSGLVREELIRGVTRMLDQQLEFLVAADKMKRRVLGMTAARAQGSLI